MLDKGADLSTQPEKIELEQDDLLKPTRRPTARRLSTLHADPLPPCNSHLCDRLLARQVKTRMQHDGVWATLMALTLTSMRGAFHACFHVHGFHSSLHSAPQRAQHRPRQSRDLGRRTQGQRGRSVEYAVVARHVQSD